MTPADSLSRERGEAGPEPGQGHPLIEIKDVVKVYRMGQVEVHALRGVSFQVQRGEMLAIMGPSGSGKSTLMNIIGCLDRPTSGSYRLEGMEISTLNDNRLAEIRSRKIGFVFQIFNLLSRTSAVANVELPLLYSGAPHRRKRALEMLERVGLSARANHHPSELSGGEQQRVAIARALANNPSIILADEPTGNLDSRAGQEVLALFNQLNRDEGITLVIVTHERDIARHCQRSVQLRDGRIVGEDSVPQGGTASGPQGMPE